MSNIIKDIKTVANVFLDMWRARKNGTEIVLEEKKVLPVIRSGGFYGTVEGCVLNHLDNEIGAKARAVFNALPDEVKYQLQFAPKSGEFKDRANLWRAALRPIMTDRQYHIAMNCIITWYIHIIKMEKERAVA